jgi:hypothetical protein
VRDSAYRNTLKNINPIIKNPIDLLSGSSNALATCMQILGSF